MRRRPGWTRIARCFARLRLEKLVTAIFIGLITFVAGLNILVVLAMTVTDRAKDIAVLMAMGARAENRFAACLWCWAWRWAESAPRRDLAAGYGIAWTAGTYQLIPLDPQIYSVPFVPFDPNALDALWIAGGGAADQRGFDTGAGALGGAHRAGGDFAIRVSVLQRAGIIAGGDFGRRSAFYCVRERQGCKDSSGGYRARRQESGNRSDCK